MKTCQICYKPIQDGATHCASCGAEMLAIQPETIHNPNLISCPSCGASVSKNAAACPSCAEPIAPARTNTQGINMKDPLHIAGVVIAIAIVIGIGLYIYVAFADAAYDRESAIDRIKYDNAGGQTIP